MMLENSLSAKDDRFCMEAFVKAFPRLPVMTGS